MRWRRIAAIGLALCVTTPAGDALAQGAKTSTTAKTKKKKKPSKKKPVIDKAGLASGKKIKRLKADRKFWSWLANPHGREIAVVLSKVDQNRQLARGMGMFSHQGAFQPEQVKEKRRALLDAAGMLRYARKLGVDNPKVLSALAEVAESLGETRVAIEAYEALLALPEEKRKGFAPAHKRLGLLHARRGEWDKAAHNLEIGVSEGTSPFDVTTLTYALVEMERGNTEKAIDFLINVPGLDGTFAQLALAVAYDRNDEETRASMTLDKLRTSQTLNGAINPPYGTDILSFTPAHDLHYFRALLYEGTGHLAEARAEWLAYVRAAPSARYRAQALRHIRDIDSLGDTRPANKPKKPLGGTRPRFRPVP